MHMAVDLTLSMMVAGREYVMVVVSPNMTMPRRGCMSVSGKGYVSLMGMGEEKHAISSDSQS